MLQKFSLEYYINNKMKIYLILAFLTILLSKIYLSLKFTTPWIFADEVVYDEIAQNILTGNFFSQLLYCQTYPPGYSLLLSIAHLLSNDKDIVYHLMLTINCLLTSSVIFPSYFILKKYCSEKISLLGSITISLLPSVTLYSFVLMSENIFIPLTVYSVWFIIESFEQDQNKLWDVFAGFSVFYLFFTRATGIAMVCALLVAFAYYAWKKSNEEGIFSILKEKIFLLASLFVPLILWIIYKKVISSTDVVGYNTEAYLGILLNAFTSLQSFKTIIFISLHEIEYLIISSYVIIFIIASLFIIDLFRKPDHKKTFVQNFNNSNEYKNIVALKASMIYFITFAFILMIITITHMQIEVLKGNQYYQIFGRYVDPIVPLIFLFAIIAMNYVFSSNCEFRNNFIGKLVSISGVSIVVFIFTFPYQYYKFPTMIPIYYIQQIKNIIPIEIYIIIISIIPLFVFYMGTKHKNANSILFLFLILLSLSLSIYPFQIELQASDNVENINQMGRYLQKHSDDTTLILMDNENFNEPKGTQMWFLTTYWANGDIVRYSTNESPSGVHT